MIQQTVIMHMWVVIQHLVMSLGGGRTPVALICHSQKEAVFVFEHLLSILIPQSFVVEPSTVLDHLGRITLLSSDMC